MFVIFSLFSILTILVKQNLLYFDLTFVSFFYEWFDDRLVDAAKLAYTLLKVRNFYVYYQRGLVTLFAIIYSTLRKSKLKSKRGLN